LALYAISRFRGRGIEEEEEEEDGATRGGGQTSNRYISETAKDNPSILYSIPH